MLYAQRTHLLFSVRYWMTRRRCNDVGWLCIKVIQAANIDCARKRIRTRESKDKRGILKILALFFASQSVDLNCRLVLKQGPDVLWMKPIESVRPTTIPPTALANYVLLFYSKDTLAYHLSFLTYVELYQRKKNRIWMRTFTFDAHMTDEEKKARLERDERSEEELNHRNSLIGNPYSGHHGNGWKRKSTIHISSSCFRLRSNSFILCQKKTFLKKKPFTKIR